MKAWKKNMDGKANARRKRSKGKANQRKQNSKNMNANSNFDPNDTLSYFNGSAGRCNSIIIIMNSAITEQKHFNTKSDTIVISYSKTESEVNELDRVQIDNYFRRSSAENLSLVTISDCDPSTKKDEIKYGAFLQRAAKVRDVLIEKGVPKKKINYN